MENSFLQYTFIVISLHVYLLRESVTPKLFHKLEPVYRNEQKRKTDRHKLKTRYKYWAKRWWESVNKYHVHSFSENISSLTRAAWLSFSAACKVTYDQNKPIHSGEATVKWKNPRILCARFWSLLNHIEDMRLFSRKKTDKKRKHLRLQTCFCV